MITEEQRQLYAKLRDAKLAKETYDNGSSIFLTGLIGKDNNYSGTHKPNNEQSSEFVHPPKASKAYTF